MAALRTVFTTLLVFLSAFCVLAAPAASAATSAPTAPTAFSSAPEERSNDRIRVSAKDRSFERMEERVRACTACHGTQGRAGPDGYYPRLAGKPEGYLYNQLTHFREGRRHYPLMRGLLANLSDAYLLDIARYFAQQDAPYPAPSAYRLGAAAMARGQQLAQRGDAARSIPACTQCHGERLNGMSPNVPGLLGLPKAYLSAQLMGWKNGQRQAHAPDCMRSITQALVPEDIEAVSAWLANQRPPGSTPGSASPAPPTAAPAAAPLTSSTPTASSAFTLPQLRCGSAPLPTPASAAAAAAASSLPADAALATPAQRGAYLARVGNCAQCHTRQGGAPYAGGLPIKTPFGSVYSSNLTPDLQHGLGRWSAQDFWQAMHHGVSKDGRLLSPAFPYTSFTHVNRADSDALWAYLQTLPAVAQPNTPHSLRWPFGTQAALWTWRSLFFRPADTAGSQVAQAGQAGPVASAPPMARGEYLVRGLGHCNECHAPRNALGASRPDRLGSGQVLPGTPWHAPSLLPGKSLATTDWSEAALVRLLTQGITPYGYTAGPMAEVVFNSTQYLRPEDARAIAQYLRADPNPSTGLDLHSEFAMDRSADISEEAPEPPETSPPSAELSGNDANAPGVPKRSLGAQRYQQDCAQCHGAKGQGRPGAYPALAGNPSVTQPLPNNLILRLWYGGYPSATPANPRPYGMPPFELRYSDADTAAVLSYIRNAWGNRAAPVTVFDINQLRR